MSHRSDGEQLYKSLCPGEKEFRLLLLLPGQHADQLTCRLTTASLTSSVEYEALSYVWGSVSDEAEQLIVNGFNHLIGHNLAQALRHLRSMTVSRTFWIDAICINQADLQERTSQVRLMGEIYRTALRTVVWLGAFGEPGSLAMDLIHRIAVGDIGPALFEPEHDEARDCLHVVLLCPWWQRAWIIQELALSKGDPILHCGSSSLPWSEYVRFWDVTTTMKMQKQPQHPSEAARWQKLAAHIAPLRLMREWPTSQRSWARLILLTSHYHATDPRDRVFALHGLLNNQVQAGWLPDYEISIPSAFTSFTKYMIQEHGLDFICYDKPRVLQNLPSWVHDYSSICSLVDTGGHEFLPEEIVNRADAGTLPDNEFSRDDKILCVRGLQVGCVDAVVLSGQEIGMKAVFEQSRQIFSDLISERECRPPGVFDPIDETTSLGNILGCRRQNFKQGYSHQLDELLSSSHRWNFQPDASNTLGPREQNIMPMLDFMFHAVKRHKFFSTDSAFCGMGPTGLQKGDWIVVAFGCAMPLVLRPLTSAESFEFIGSCGMPSIAKGQFSMLNTQSRTFEIR